MKKFIALCLIFVVAGFSFAQDDDMMLEGQIVDIDDY